MATIKDIDNILPQTQCGECGYLGCRPYAEALFQGSAPIDKCPPGGVETVISLGKLLKRDPEPYLENIKQNTRLPSIAVIREAECIGCSKCIQACPVDAIIGTAKHMHSVLNHECTGCGLCVAPCPVDCIEMQSQEDITYNKPVARERYEKRQIRLLREEQEKEKVYQEKRLAAAQTSNKQSEKQAKLDYIQAAINRVNARKVL